MKACATEPDARRALNQEGRGRNGFRSVERKRHRGERTGLEPEKREQASLRHRAPPPRATQNVYCVAKPKRTTTTIPNAWKGTVELATPVKS